MKKLDEVYRNSGLGKWFHGESATKEPGWDRYNSEGKRVGKCGDAEEGSSYSACLSKQKAKKLGKEGRSSFVKRKRAAQSKADRGKKGAGSKGKKPINVDTGASKMDECYECEQGIILEGKNKPNDPEKWSACKSAAKAKFDVYPSAYANAWAAKCYKKKGGTWHSIKEVFDLSTLDRDLASASNEELRARIARTKAETAAIPQQTAAAMKDQDKIMLDAAERMNRLTAQLRDLRSSQQQNRQRLQQNADQNKALIQQSNTEKETALKDIEAGNYEPYIDYQGSSPTRPSKYLPVVQSQQRKEAALKDIEAGNYKQYAEYPNVPSAPSVPPEKQWKTPEDVAKGVVDLLNVKEELQQLTKQNIISNLIESKTKAKFAKKEGNLSQRPKHFGKGGKAGTERTQERREGKREAQERLDEENINDFFGTDRSGVTRGLSRNWGVSQEDSRYYKQDRAIARMNANSKWATQQLMPVYIKHGMAEEHAGTTDEYGFPAYGHAVSHPNFKAFAEDFIKFHTAKNQEHWKQHGKASSYHWPAILRAKQGLQSMQRYQQYKAEQNKNTPGDMSESWENREQQRMHAPHEDPMVYGGEHEEHDPYPHVSEGHRHDLEKAWNEGLKHGHEHAELMAHANLHGVIDAITRMHAHMEGASHEWNARHAAKGIEKIAQHLEYNRRFLDRKYNERMKKNAPDPGAGDIPF